MYVVSILETIRRRKMYLNGSNTCCTFSMLSLSNMYMNRAHEHVYEKWLTKKVHKSLCAFDFEGNMLKEELQN